MKQWELEKLVSVHFDSLSAWGPYRSRSCDSCMALCCRLPVEATVADLVRMEVLPPDAELSRVSLKKCGRDLTRRGIVRNFRASTGIFTLAQKPNGDCIFLGEARRCTIYEKRPQVCRDFPHVGPRPGCCPYVAKSKIKTQDPHVNT